MKFSLRKSIVFLLVLFFVMFTFVGAKVQADDTVTVDFTAQGYTNQQVVSSLKVENISVNFDKGSNSNTPKYYTSGAAIRVYGGGYVTVTSDSFVITKIVITFGSDEDKNSITADTGTYTNGTWTGSAESVKFTIGGTSGNRRFAKLEVTYEEADPTVEAIQNELNSINSYVSMGYKYAFDTEETTGYVNSYKLVTSVSELQEGDKVIIAASEEELALSTTQNTNNRGQTAISKNGEKLDNIGEDVQILTLKTGNVDGTYALYTGEGYLYAASSSKNYLKTEETLSDNSSWKITIESSGVATIKAQGSNTRNWLRYNSASNGQLFSCYASGQQDVCIYKEVTEYVQTESVVYKDADFRMRFAIDSTISELAELSNGDENFEYGIAVSNGSNTVTYNANDYQTNLLDQYNLVYVTFKLFDENDDFAANFDRLTSEFTVRAYVVYNGEKYYSENEKTYSVKTLLEKYLERTDITGEDDKQALNYLKEAFEEFGYTINK